MLTFKKALLLAAFVITCIFLFKTSHSGSIASSRLTSNSKPESLLFETDGSRKGGRYSGSRRSQKILSDSSRTLIEKLQIQFPYEPEGKFPAYIWQTWKAGPGEGEFDERLRPLEASWSTLHPTFVHEVITDKTARHLIRYLYASLPEILEAYDAMPMPVLKADFFRYLVLLARGGIYSDIDTTALKPATDWLPKDTPPSSVGLIVGIEADPDRPDWADWYSRRIQFCQWTLQAKVGHPALRKVVAGITQETLRMKKAGVLAKGKMDQSIVEFTGPARWTDAVFSYLNDPDYFKIGAKNVTWEAFSNIKKPRRVGDVVVLPITSFSPGVGQMNAGEVDDPMAFVQHDFEGTYTIGNLEPPARHTNSCFQEVGRTHGNTLNL